jgi:hypothetical protein
MGWKERADALPDGPIIEPIESAPSWKKRAESLPDEPKVGLSGPGSKDADEIKLAPNEHVPELADIPKGFVAGVKGMADTAVRANRQASSVIQHPLATLGNEQFRTETMRGVNDTIMPYIGNRAVEAIGGAPRESDADQAAFPDARPLGGVLGMAVPIPIGETVGAIKSGLGKAGANATERIIGREQAKIALRGAADDAETRAAEKMVHSKSLPEGTPEYLAARREISDLMSEATKKRRELAKITRAPSLPEILGHAALGAVTHGVSLPYTAYKIGKNAPQLADNALSKIGKLSEKIPNIGATYNPISAINKTTRGIVDRMAEIEAKHPRDYQMGAITLDHELSKLPPDFIQNRKNLDEAKRLARYALDKSLSDEERNKAIRESLDLIKDFGNE